MRRNRQTTILQNPNHCGSTERVGDLRSCFMLFELCIPAWRQYRQFGVTSFVWLVNLCIIIGLAALFTSSMLVLPYLLK